MALKAMFDSMSKITLVAFPRFVSFMSVQDMLTNTSEKLKKKNLNLVFCYQNCSSDRDKLLKLEAEDQEFAKFLISLEQFIYTEKQFMVTECFFNLFLKVPHI